MSLSIMTAAIPAISAALQLTASAVKSSQDATAINQYIDLAAVQRKLFDPEQHDDAYQQLYQAIQATVARKEIIPSVYYEGQATMALPVSTIFDLLNAAMK